MQPASMAESTAKEMGVNGNSDKNKLKKTYLLIQQLINEIGKRLSVFDTGLGSEAEQSEHIFIDLYAEENRNSPSDDNRTKNQSQNYNQQQTATIRICPPIQGV